MKNDSRAERKKSVKNVKKGTDLFSGDSLSGKFQRSLAVVGRFEGQGGQGRIKNKSVPFFVSYGFTGREWDQEIGLYFYRARYYDPEVGRFVGKDPIGFAGGDVNLYRYANANPVNLTDPMGLYSDCELLEDQEKASSSAFAKLGIVKARICGQSLLTCQKNCGTSFCTDESKKLECEAKCIKSFNSCNNGKGFKHPEMIKNKFCGPKQ